MWMTKENKDITEYDYALKKKLSAPHLRSMLVELWKIEDFRDKHKHVWSEEMKQYLSEKFSGEGNPHYGKHLTDE